MAKYLVETISMFRMRYVIEAENAEHAKDEVTMNDDGELREFSQMHVDENITSVRESTAKNIFVYSMKTTIIYENGMTTTNCHL